MTVDIDDVRERIQRGAELLDDHYTRWEDAIDTSILELADVLKCVLGQIGGDPEFHGQRDYDAMLPIVFPETETHDERREISASHGFDVTTDAWDAEQEYEALTHEWVRLIEERKTK